MRFFKLILTFFTLGYFIFGQDTPVNLESNAVSHNEIQLNWNAWDPADSYFDAIVYIENIEEVGPGTVEIDFRIKNVTFGDIRCMAKGVLPTDENKKMLLKDNTPDPLSKENKQNSFVVAYENVANLNVQDIIDYVNK